MLLTALFQRVCDLEGIVDKQKFGPYVTEREHSTRFKINGREDLFERERHSEAVSLEWRTTQFSIHAALGDFEQRGQTFRLSASPVYGLSTARH